MPRKATGSLRRLVSGWEARVRVKGVQRSFPLTGCDTEHEARERCQLLARLASVLVSAGHAGDASTLLEMAAARRGQAVEDVVQAVDALTAGKTRPIRPETGLTFKDVGTAWTSGELHEKWPDHVPLKRSVRDDKQRLTKLYDSIGDVRMIDFRLRHAEQAMNALPVQLTAATRRQYAQLIQRVLSLAVYPLRIIDQSPIPARFKPKLKGRKAFAYLYPEEDARLLCCSAIPLGYRLLYGFLAREGCRTSESTSLAWKDLDLERGVLTLDRNKTDDARAWALDPGVARALRVWREQHRAGDTPDAPVFSDEHGSFEDRSLAKRLRSHLKLAAVERSELFAKGENRGQLRAHDLRGTFVTLSLAQGRSETWVADRTGHTTSQMINRYRRAARSAQELRLGSLTPLDQAIPELRPVSIKAMIETWRGWRGRREKRNRSRSLRAPSDSNGRPTDSKSVALSS
jgi:integrase